MQQQSRAACQEAELAAHQQQHGRHHQARERQVAVRQLHRHRPHGAGAQRQQEQHQQVDATGQHGRHGAL
ncbi:MAG: hypothetical protein IPH76_07690 [Xanthomonadales bacterium]|nr:hypothetical protein [Xanthomonadales bacterium]